MDTYGIVLFVHIFLVVATFGAAAIMHLSMFELRKATTLDQARLPALRMAVIEPIFPIAALGLFLAGAYLVHLSYEWSTGWISVAIVGLVVMEAIGGTILRTATKVLHTAVTSADPAGPLPEQVMKMAIDRTVWVSAHLATGLAFGIVFLMTTKPVSVIGAIVVLLAFAAGAAASALPFTVAPPAPEKLGQTSETNS